jgi:hypothetical protein
VTQPVALAPELGLAAAAAPASNSAVAETSNPFSEMLANAQGALVAEAGAPATLALPVALDEDEAPASDAAATPPEALVSSADVLGAMQLVLQDLIAVAAPAETVSRQSEGTFEIAATSTNLTTGENVPQTLALGPTPLASETQDVSKALLQGPAEASSALAQGASLPQAGVLTTPAEAVPSSKPASAIVTGQATAAQQTDIAAAVPPPASLESSSEASAVTSGERLPIHRSETGDTSSSNTEDASTSNEERPAASVETDFSELSSPAANPGAVTDAPALVASNTTTTTAGAISSNQSVPLAADTALAGLSVVSAINGQAATVSTSGLTAPAGGGLANVDASVAAQIQTVVQQGALNTAVPGQTTLSVKLSPEHLGDVQIHISTLAPASGPVGGPNGGIVNARLVLHQAEAGTALAQDLNQLKAHLRDQLAERNLTLGDITVSVLSSPAALSPEAAAAMTADNDTNKQRRPDEDAAERQQFATTWEKTGQQGQQDAGRQAASFQDAASFSSGQGAAASSTTNKGQTGGFVRQLGQSNPTASNPDGRVLAWA